MHRNTHMHTNTHLEASSERLLVQEDVAEGFTHRAGLLLDPFL
jgi:hypothetical protein